MAEDEFVLDILLKPHHPLTDVALRYPGRQKLIGKPAAFGLPEFQRIRAMPSAEFAGATLDIGSSGSGGESNTLPSLEAAGRWVISSAIEHRFP